MGAVSSASLDDTEASFWFFIWIRFPQSYYLVLNYGVLAFRRADVSFLDFVLRRIRVMSLVR
jgi:hypothetical protein